MLFLIITEITFLIYATLARKKVGAKQFEELYPKTYMLLFMQIVLLMAGVLAAALIWMIKLLSKIPYGKIISFLNIEIF